VRELTGHHVNGVNDGIKVYAVDDPQDNPGKANHEYDVMIGKIGYTIRFQKGAIKEAGPNGFTHEVLLELIKDRLHGFQSGPYACQDNAEALTHVEAAQECLLRRTRARAARGVEGTVTV